MRNRPQTILCRSDQGLDQRGRHALFGAGKSLAFSCHHRNDIVYTHIFMRVFYIELDCQSDKARSGSLLITSIVFSTLSCFMQYRQ